jgi:hypothetical protein
LIEIIGKTPDVSKVTRLTTFIWFYSSEVNSNIWQKWYCLIKLFLFIPNNNKKNPTFIGRITNLGIGFISGQDFDYFNNTLYIVFFKNKRILKIIRNEKLK